MRKLEVKKLMEEVKENLINEMRESKIDGGAFCDYNEGAYICDVITEIADYNIDIYNSDLFDWAKYNYSIIEEANDELGTPSDIIKQIQQGQFIQNERDIYDNLNDMLLVYCYNVLIGNGIEEITEDQNDNLKMYSNNLDNNDRLPDIEDIINEIGGEDDE